VRLAWRIALAVTVTRLGTIEVSRARPGTASPKPGRRCSSAVPRAVRSGLERGEIGWRDLVDLDARHRRRTYQFTL
jgi:hypothetical protein